MPGRRGFGDERPLLMASANALLHPNHMITGICQLQAKELHPAQDLASIMASRNKSALKML